MWHSDNRRDPRFRYLTQPQRNWYPASAATTSEQRRALVHGFLNLEIMPAEWFTPQDGTPTDPPTSDQVRHVLQPWRPQKLRKIAQHLLHYRSNDLVILRTHYDDDGTENEWLSEWLERDKEQDMLYGFGEEWWRILSDRALFNFGDEWRDIFLTLPELVGRYSSHSQGLQKSIGPAWIAEARNAEDCVDEVQFLSYVGQSPLLVADRDAFEEEVLRAIFLDSYGNVVRYSEVRIYS
ncbi:hypothetical protein TruAng_008972 [Truncatella angustata]|nr:hypothetical protein TruAng_008972 [Truncatella angustata]